MILNYPYTEADLVHLLANDDDPFNRWEAAQRLATDIILKKNGKPYRGVPGCHEGSC